MLWQAFCDTVDRSIENAEKGLDNFIDKGDKVTKAWDKINSTLKDVSRNGLQRNHLDDLYENKRLIEENMPKDLPSPQPIRNISRAVDIIAHGITLVVDKVQENKKI